MKNTYLGLAAAALLAAGCGDNNATISAGSDPEMGLGHTKQEEAWSAQDNPALFSTSLEFKLAALPTSGEAQSIPWAGSYWPTYEDNINFQWDGASSDSAAKKYEKAFGGTGVEDAVSKYHGIDSTSGKECSDASVCDSSMGETCAKRAGKDKGRCVPTWWGICHAWTPAAILLPEPKHAVTKNGITFQVQDLKALGSLVHNSTSTKFISLRCDKQGATQADGGGVTYDQYGRPSSRDSECRDTNPGTYHVILTNYLGKQKQAFAEDRTMDHEVWNQPVRGFRVTSQKEVTAQEANRLIGATSVGGTTTRKTGTVAKAAWAHQGSFPIAAGQAVKVVMTGTGDADLYVKFGAQPTEAAYDCRPYAGGTDETCELTAPAGATAVFVSVNGYADTSSFGLDVTVGGQVPANYVFNPKAVKFQQVTTEVDYISESSPAEGNLSARIDQYTRTDRYDYILELDADGKIIGGEWLGDSKRAHPDFLWLPLGPQGSSVAGGKITYANVKALIDASVADENGGGGAQTEQTKVETGSLAKGEWKHFGPFNVAAGGKLAVDLSGTGDADLYVRAGSAPTATAYDCRPYQSGSAESCSVTKTGPIYVAVYGYAASTFTAKMVWTASGGTVTPPPATVSHLNVSGNVAQGEMKVFTLALPAGKKISITTTAASDVDLYLKAGAAPTTAVFDARAWTSSGNETLTYTAPDNVTLQIGVHGYQASAFTLKTQDN